MLWLSVVFELCSWALVFRRWWIASRVRLRSRSLLRLVVLARGAAVVALPSRRLLWSLLRALAGSYSAASAAHRAATGGGTR